MVADRIGCVEATNRSCHALEGGGWEARSILGVH